MTKNQMMLAAAALVALVMYQRYRQAVADGSAASMQAAIRSGPIA